MLTTADLVFDREAVALVLRELGAAYSAAKTGKASALSAPSSYGTFIEQSREHEERATASERFWLDQFKDGAPSFELPTDHPRPPVKSYKGARVVTVLGAPVLERLRQAGTPANLSPSVMIAAAFHLLLAHITGKDDLVLGTEGRHRVGDVSTLAANRTNPLVIRTRLYSSAPLTKYLQDYLRESLETYDHQDYPFSHLIQKLNPPRDESRSALFGVSFVLGHLESPSFEGTSPRRRSLRLSRMRSTTSSAARRSVATAS